jgi:1-acyl-sn-glycerol-3-phosphate acyltransferase
MYAKIMEQIPGWGEEKFEEPKKDAIKDGREKPEEHSSKRMMLGFESLIRLQVGNVKIEGREHLDELPRERKIIVATTHLTDLDVPLAVSALGNDLDLAIVNMSVHHSFKGEASTYLGMVAAGKDHFIPIDYTKDKETGEKRAGSFNTENFKPMQEALDSGKRVLIAAHNPSHDFEFDKASYGVAYLAELSGALILPVAVQLKSEGDVGMYGSGVKTFLKKPNAEVHIGAPFEVQKIEGIEEFTAILEKRKSGEKLTKEDLQRFSELKKLLKDQSEQVLKRLAELLPDKESHV